MQRKFSSEGLQTLPGFEILESGPVTNYVKPILSPGGSRAKTSLHLVGEMVLSEGLNQASGESLQTLLATYDPDTSSLRMSQQCFSLLGNQADELLNPPPSSASCQTWPKSGLMRNGNCYQLAPLAHHRNAKGFSLWPTPVASEAIRAKFSIEQLLKHSEKQMEAGNGIGGLVPTLAAEYGQFPTPEFAEWLQGFPLGYTDLEE